MPWNGTGTASRSDGTYTGSTVWAQNKAAGILITTAAHDAHDQDLLTMINTCLTKDGQNAATAALPMGGFNHTGVGAATARTHYATAAQIADGSLTWGGTAGGTADALTISVSPAITAYASGQLFGFRAASANATTTPTLNVNGVGAKTIVTRNNEALVANSIVAGAICLVQYHSTLDKVFLVGAVGQNELIAAGAALQGKQPLWLPAGAWTPRTTNGPSRGSTELSSNKIMLPTLDYDAATEEAAQYPLKMPKQANDGTITAIPVWTAASGSGDVIFGLRAVAFSNDDAIDTAMGTGQTSTDTLLSANDAHFGPETSAITAAGSPNDQDIWWLESYRKAADGSDTLGVDAKLIGWMVFITTNAGNEA